MFLSCLDGQKRPSHVASRRPTQARKGSTHELASFVEQNSRNRNPQTGNRRNGNSEPKNRNNVPHFMRLTFSASKFRERIVLRPTPRRRELRARSEEHT